MHRHWKGLLLFVGFALVAFIVAMMYQLYMVAVGLLLATIVLAGMYSIGMAQFRGRPDAPDEQRTRSSH